MTSHRAIPVEARQAWTEALREIPHGTAHTWGHCHAMSLSSGLPTYLYQFEGSGARVVCALAERRFQGHADIVTPYGFGGFAGTAECPDFPARWREFVAGRRYVCGYIQLSPVLGHETYFDSRVAEVATSVFTLDLRPPVEQLFANLHANRKRQLREPLAGDVRIVWDDARLSAFFQEEYAHFVLRAGAAPLYRFSAATLSFLCSLDDVFLVGAEVGDRLEAVMMFGHTAYVGDYLFGVALPEGRRHAAHLLWSRDPAAALAGGSVAEPRRRRPPGRRDRRIQAPVRRQGGATAQPPAGVSARDVSGAL